jgi:hypothetical protein
MVSLNKAFELVAIIGPSLYWQSPTREVKSTDVPDQTQIAQLLGITERDMLEQIQQVQGQKTTEREIRNSLASLVLEYIGREHPGGTKIDNELIIQDALVTGRGCGWTETYTNRSTGQPMVGTFYDPVDNLLIDPDAKDPALRDVKWMARKHVEPVWVVERRFGYPPGYLQGRGTPTDPKAAFHWYEASAKAGYADAEYMLGECYRTGAGTKRDGALALSWYLKAARNGSSAAQLMAASIYYTGEGWRRELPKAMVWAELARLNGEAQAVGLAVQISRDLNDAQKALAVEKARLCRDSKYQDCPE